MGRCIFKHLPIVILNFRYNGKTNRSLLNMLSNTSKLYFPKIVYDKITSLNTVNESDALYKPQKLYRLDWSRKQSKCSKNQNGEELTHEYEQFIMDARFLISDVHLREIRRVSWKAIEEWNVHRQLDTYLKNIYLKPAAAYVEVAFQLLSDCLYDHDTLSYQKGTDKLLSTYILLYKFWINQVPGDSVLDFCDIESLMAICYDTTGMPDDFAVKVNEFLSYVNNTGK